MVTGAKHFSFGSTLLLLGGTLFWNGIIYFFVVQAIEATLYNLKIPMPGWITLPSNFPDCFEMGPRATVFFWLFLTPFIGIGMMLVVNFFVSLFGRTEVRVLAGVGTIFTGIGPVGYRRHFDASLMKDLFVGENVRSGDSDVPRKRDIIIIELQNGKRLKFGSMFTDDRRYYVAGVLWQTLFPQK